jgi:predicted acyltransferase
VGGSATISGVPARLRSLDWLRGIAVLVMVECHVFNALLASEFRSERWFGILNWLNGFVAPAFLLVSGAVMGINLQKRWGKGTGKMWRRVGQIFIVAYLLHLPTPFLWQFFGPRGPHLVELWTKMDILQCIAGSLTIILALVPVCRTPKLHRIVCLVLGVTVAVFCGSACGWGRRFSRAQTADYKPLVPFSPV